MSHKESQQTYDLISNWIAPNFFLSKREGWERFGILGMFGDMVLTSVPVGHIIDIGCGESSIYLSHLARKYRRQIYHCDLAMGKITNPLTVAGYMYPEALSIDKPDHLYNFGNSYFYAGTSDDLFKEIKDVPLALSFIDGDHVYEQAKKDFDNAVNLTVDNGYILLHDTYPPNEEYLNEWRCGGVYKLRQEIEADARFDTLTLVHGVAMDVGLTICRVKPKHRPFYQE